MIEILNAIILAIVQGLTEWLPVSSSGHLVLFQSLLNYQPGLIFDVAVHFGTLMAVFVYFGKDIIDIIEDFLKLRTKSDNFRLGLLLIIGSIPAGIIGFIFRKYFELAFSSLLIVAFGFAITSLLLYIGSLKIVRNKNKNNNSRFGFFGAFFVGCFQALAIFPGISRSGSTISSGLIFGLKERDAVKFSFLLAIPAIFGAAILEIGNNKLPPEMIWATLVAFVVGLATIYFLLKIIEAGRENLRWFALYCLLLAIGVFGYLIFF